MNNMNKITRAGALVAGALLAGNAAAVPFTGDGEWTDVSEAEDMPVEALTFAADAASISWGAGGTRQSGYDYVPFSGDAPTDASLIALGDFTHNNFAIRLPSIIGADLDLSIGFPEESAEVNLSLALDHIETDNQMVPCAEGGVPLCPDVVVVPDASERVTFGDGAIYDFEIIGFSQDGGATLTSRFLTQENAINTATLFGRLVLVEEPPAVPAPVTSSGATLPLTAIFASSLLLAARRRG